MTKLVINHRDRGEEGSEITLILHQYRAWRHSDLTQSFEFGTGTNDPAVLEEMRDVLDQEIGSLGGECWREAFEDIMRIYSPDGAPPRIAARALGPKPEGVADPRVTLTRAGEDCKRYRRVVENLVAWGAGHAVAMSLSNKSDPLRGILDDARAALEAK